MDTELNEKQPLIEQNKGRGRGRGIQGNGAQGAAGFGRGHAYKRTLGRGSRSPGWENRDVESDLSENGSRESSIKSAKSDCPTVQDLNAIMQNGPEPRDQPYLEDERQHQRQIHQYEGIIICTISMRLLNPNHRTTTTAAAATTAATTAATAATATTT